MTKENQKVIYEHLLSVGRTADAEAIDKIYNFSGNKKKEENVLEKLEKQKTSKKAKK